MERLHGQGLREALQALQAISPERHHCRETGFHWAHKAAQPGQNATSGRWVVDGLSPWSAYLSGVWTTSRGQAIGKT